MSRLALLSNVTADIVKSFFTEDFEVFTPYGYGAWFEDAIADGSGLAAFHPEAIAFLFDGNAMIEGSQGRASRASALDEELAKIRCVLADFSSAFILLPTIDLRRRAIRPLSSPIEERELEWRWYEGVQAIIAERPNAVIFDIKGIVEEMGRTAFYDSKMWYAGGIPFSLRASKRIAEEARLLLRAYSGKRKKCLAVDLDNTIWGGVVGEDGAVNLILGESKEGAVFRDIQKRIRELKDTGVVLVALSKNNRDDALAPFRENSHMVLQEKDFVGIVADWNRKADNLKSLAATLNIGSDAFVFLDDNPVEQEEMKSLAPEVEVIPIAPKALYDESVIAKLYRDYFAILRLTEEDRRKTESYASDAGRIELKGQSVSLEEYLRKLQISLRFRRAGAEEAERVAQLTQKTNQFNLTTKRRMLEEIKNLMADEGHRIYAAWTKDKFGDNGLVWVAIVRIEGTVATFDTVLMSCRVMGRLVEQAAMACAETDLFGLGVRELRGEYVPTPKNVPAKDFYDKLGYERLPCSGGQATSYRKELIGPGRAPECLEIVEE
jgi:HAD-superfamily phosphatase, subfamily IIIC/FkbH-like domain